MTPHEERIYHLVRAQLKPEMVDKCFRDLGIHNYCGHCHHATIALYNLLGGKHAGYKVNKAIDEQGIKHYWLTSPTGENIDPTVEQYTDLGRCLPYLNSIKTGISYRISNNARMIMDNIKVILDA